MAALLLLLLRLIPLAASPPSPPAPLTVLPALSPQAVATRPGTAIALRPPARHSNESVLPVDRPYEGAPLGAGGGGITYATVLRVDGSYMMWYSAMYNTLTPSRDNSTASQHNYSLVLCVALSADGIAWRKPALHLFAEDGNTANNIVLRGQDLYGASVVQDAVAADPAERFKLVYWAVLGYFVDDHGGHHEQGGMFTATSPDGIHWRHTRGPVLTAYMGDQGVEVPLAGTPQPQQCELRGCCTCYNLPQTVSDVQALTYDPVRRGWSVYHKTWIDGPDGMCQSPVCSLEHTRKAAVWCADNTLCTVQCPHTAVLHVRVVQVSSAGGALSGTASALTSTTGPPRRFVW